MNVSDLHDIVDGLVGVHLSGVNIATLSGADMLKNVKKTFLDPNDFVEPKPDHIAMSGYRCRAEQWLDPKVRRRGEEMGQIETP